MNRLINKILMHAAGEPAGGGAGGSEPTTPTPSQIEPDGLASGSDFSSLLDDHSGGDEPEGTTPSPGAPGGQQGVAVPAPTPGQAAPAASPSTPLGQQPTGQPSGAPGAQPQAQPSQQPAPGQQQQPAAPVQAPAQAPASTPAPAAQQPQGQPAAQAQPPAEQMTFEKHQEKFLPELEKLYAFDPKNDKELLEELEDKPLLVKMLSQKAAQIHYQVQMATMAGVMQAVQQMLPNYISQHSKSEQDAGEFYKMWPVLKDSKYDGTVKQAIMAFKQANPSASMEEVTRKAGLFAMMTHNLPLPMPDNQQQQVPQQQGQPQQQQVQQQQAAPGSAPASTSAGPQGIPGRPAGAGSSPASPQAGGAQPGSIWEQMVEDHRTGVTD